MNERRSLYIKLGYLAGIVALLFPLSLLGRPAAKNDLGGEISQLRVKYKIAQSKIGKIDPASTAIKLSTLGLRGLPEYDQPDGSHRRP